jgi:hypothetical protein
MHAGWRVVNKSVRCMSICVPSMYTCAWMLLKSASTCMHLFAYTAHRTPCTISGAPPRCGAAMPKGSERHDAGVKMEIWTDQFYTWCRRCKSCDLYVKVSRVLHTSSWDEIEWVGLSDIRGLKLCLKIFCIWADINTALLLTKEMEYVEWVFERWHESRLSIKQRSLLAVFNLRCDKETFRLLSRSGQCRIILGRW